MDAKVPRNSIIWVFSKFLNLLLLFFRSLYVNILISVNVFLRHNSFYISLKIVTAYCPNTWVPTRETTQQFWTVKIGAVFFSWPNFPVAVLHPNVFGSLLRIIHTCHIFSCEREWRKLTIKYLCLMWIYSYSWLLKKKTFQGLNVTSETWLPQIPWAVPKGQQSTAKRN